MGNHAIPTPEDDNIVDKYFGRKSFTEDGNVIMDSLNPFEKADIVRYHLFELSYISVVSILEKFVLDLCKTVINSLNDIDNKDGILKRLSFGGLNSCLKFLDEKSGLESSNILESVEV